MLRKTTVTMVTLSFLMLLAAAVYALPLINFQAASLVLGQPNFAGGSSGLSATQVNTPGKVAVDPTTGKVFVADTRNSRVLRFAGGTALVNGAAAEAVLGQSNFTSNVAIIGPNSMDQPIGVFVDAAGRLWVADTGNHRVLRFDNAASKVNGANADGVLGQADLISKIAATTKNRMMGPSDVFVETTGQLWVADAINSRVLRFDNAASKANGTNADGVLGQPDFINNNPNISQSGMDHPVGVSGDAAGRLWVAEEFNHRVLWFNNATAKANGANADGVMGQPNFTSNTPNNGGRSAQSLDGPLQLFYDHSGGDMLWVTDGSNHRVLRYNNYLFYFLPIILKN